MKRDELDQKVAELLGKGWNEKRIKAFLMARAEEDLQVEGPVYEPYGGPAGPSESQISRNDKALMIELDRLGIPYDYSTHPKHAEWEFAEPFNTINIKNPAGDEIYVSYDRWGFVADSDTVDTDLDQATYADTVKYIKQFMGVKSNLRQMASYGK